MGVTVDAPTRGRPRDPRRREAILHAAMALVAEVGYDRVTVDALAARAGVSKPTIYRRWPGGKPEIIADAIRAKRAEGAALPDTGSLRGDLLAMLGAIRGTVEEDAHLLGGLVTQLRLSPELAELFREEAIADERRRYDVLLERAAARGEISLPVTSLFADIAGSVMFTRCLIDVGPLDQAYILELVDHVLLPIVNAANRRTGN
jgi:AcrR family transcriptional regulator